MAKYINADKLAKDLERLCDIVCQYSKEQRDVMCVSCPLGDAFELLDNQPAADVQEAFKAIHDAPVIILPAADVVEVVRCKDCKYLDYVDEHEKWCMGRGNPATMVKDDGYCEIGKRKEERRDE